MRLVATHSSGPAPPIVPGPEPPEPAKHKTVMEATNAHYIVGYDDACWGDPSGLPGKIKLDKPGPSGRYRFEEGQEVLVFRDVGISCQDNWDNDTVVASGGGLWARLHPDQPGYRGPSPGLDGYWYLRDDELA